MRHSLAIFSCLGSLALCSPHVVAVQNAAAGIPAPSSIKGRLLRPDGTAAKGITIFTGNFNDQIVTDANGRFEIKGITNGALRLQVRSVDQKLSFIVPTQEITNLKAGEVRDIGDWKTEMGTRITGLIVSAVGKKPVANASILGSSANNSTSTQSDKTGAFELLVPSDVTGLWVRAQGFLGKSWNELPKARAGVIDMGTLELKRGQKLGGVIVDGAGKAVAGASVYVETKEGARTWAAPTQADGSFSFESLEAGIYVLKSNGLEFAGDSTVRVESDKPTTVRLVTKQDGTQGDKRAIKGKVVDDKGAPVAGAKVVLVVKGERGSYSVHGLESQADGTFQLLAPGVVTNVQVQSVSASGFLRDQEQITSPEGQWDVNLTLQKSGTLRGRVVDAEGKAIKGAFVATQGGEELPVVTDDNGAFSLSGVPLKAVKLLASNGAVLATFEVKAPDSEQQIVLPEVAPPGDKAALADQLLQEATISDDWASLWTTLGTRRIEAVLHNKLVDPKNSKWSLYLAEMAQREPQTLLKREAELREQTGPRERTEFERLMMLAKAKSEDAKLREEARLWLAGQEKDPRDISSETVMRLIGLAQVGVRYGENEEYKWLDYAAQVAERLDAKTLAVDIGQWSALAARVEPGAPHYLSQNWNDRTQMRFLAYAMRTWIADGNAEAARQGWEDLQLLAPTAEKSPVTAETAVFEQPSEILNQTRTRYATFLARTDAKAALEMAKPLADYDKAGVLLTVAQAAVEKKQFEVAREALNSLVALQLGQPFYIARAAAIAERFDTAFAAPLWTQAYAKARPDSILRAGPEGLPSLATYAQERADKQGGESRVLIEREWAKRLIWNANVTTDGWNSNTESMKALVEAMAFVAPSRALEMLEQIPDKDQQRAQMRGRVAVALLRSVQTAKAEGTP